MAVRSVVFCIDGGPYANGVWDADLRVWASGVAGGASFYDDIFRFDGVPNLITIQAYLDSTLVGTSPTASITFIRVPDGEYHPPVYESSAHVSTNGVNLVTPLMDVIEYVNDQNLWGTLTQAKVYSWPDAGDAIYTPAADGPAPGYTTPGGGVPPNINFPNVYIAGNFSSAYVSLGHVAKWNGKNTWATLGGGGVNGPVSSMVVDANENVYITGQFTVAAGNAVSGLARFDGNTWSGIGYPGSCLDAARLALAPNGDLYVVGDHTNPSYVYRWDGSSWHTEATVAGGSITAVAVAANGDLWIGGQFTSVDGVSAYHIACRHSGTWAALGAGIPAGAVLVIAFDKLGIAHVAGDFTIFAGDTGSSVAWWTGATWMSKTSFGENPSGLIWTLSFNSANDMFIGGYFASVHLWKVVAGTGVLQSVGNSGFDYPVKASVVDASGNLIVGGGFGNIVGQSMVANFMAVYNGSHWAQSDNRLNAAVNAIALKPAAIKPDTPMYLVSFDVFAPHAPVTKTVFNNISFSVIEPQNSTTAVKRLVSFTINEAIGTLDFNVTEPPPPPVPATGIVEFNVIESTRYLIDFSVTGEVKLYSTITFYVNETYVPVGITLVARETLDGTLSAGRKTVSVNIYQTVGTGDDAELTLIASADASIVLVGATPGIWAEIAGIPNPYGGDIQIDGYVKGSLTYSETLPYAANVGVQLA